MNWYYVSNDERVGPVTEEAFNTLISQGQITADTMVWNDSMSDWAAYRTVQVAPASAAIPESGVSENDSGSSTCVECGLSKPVDEMLEYEGHLVCGNCKDGFFQRVREGGLINTSFQYASFGARFVAKIIDGIIMFVIGTIIQFGAGLGMGASSTPDPENPFSLVMVVALVLQYVAQGFYYVYLHGKYGATWGKMALKIKVIREDGESISYKRALGRMFAEMLSGIILYIGYLMAAWDPEKRALHDRICNTRVVKK